MMLSVSWIPLKRFGARVGIQWTGDGAHLEERIFFFSLLTVQFILTLDSQQQLPNSSLNTLGAFDITICHVSHNSKVLHSLLHHV
jgi:hypothetical protein